MLLSLSVRLSATDIAVFIITEYSLQCNRFRSIDALLFALNIYGLSVCLGAQAT